MIFEREYRFRVTFSDGAIACVQVCARNTTEAIERMARNLERSAMRSVVRWDFTRFEDGSYSQPSLREALS